MPLPTAEQGAAERAERRRQREEKEALHKKNLDYMVELMARGKKAREEAEHWLLFNFFLRFTPVVCALALSTLSQVLSNSDVSVFAHALSHFRTQT